VHPRDNEPVNETWISDRDRFSYQGLNSTERLTAPMIKRDGAWHEVDWQQALHAAADALKSVGTEQLGCLVSPTATLEEQYLLQKLVRALGHANIDSRLRQQDFRGDAADPRLPWLGVSIAELEQQQAVLLVGSDIRQEQPLLAHRIRKAALAGASVAAVNAYRLELTHPSRTLLAPPGCLTVELGALAKALGVRGSGGVKDAIDASAVTETHEAVAEQLKQAGADGKGLVLLGALAEADPDYALIRELARALAEAAGCRLGFIAAAANSMGAWLAGALPHRLPGAEVAERPGLDAAAMLADPRQGYLLWGLEPDRDLTDPVTAMAALDRAEQVVACGTFRSPALDAIADIQLPISAFAETAGTYVNAAGLWQRFQGAVAPAGEARPGWKVLRVLGNVLELDGFEQNTAKEVHDELKALCEGVEPDNAPLGVIELGFAPPAELMRVGNVPIYAVDALARHAPALQRTPLGEVLAVYLHPEQAAKLGLAAGDRVRVLQPAAVGEGTATAQVVLDDRLAMGCARVPAAVDGSEALGPQIGPLHLGAAGHDNA
jgi:NADH-quinone oxidoreductase subunit G